LQPSQRENSYLVKLERELLIKKQMIADEELTWAKQGAEWNLTQGDQSLPWRARHVKYTQSSRIMIPLTHGVIFTGEVDTDSIVYFRVDVVQPAILTVMVKKLAGDIDVFASKGAIPTMLKSDFKLAQLDRVGRMVILPNDPQGGPGTYVIGVYSCLSKPSKFSLCVSLSHLQPSSAPGHLDGFERIHARLKFLADHAETGELMWNFEMISEMADRYPQHYHEVRRDNTEYEPGGLLSDDELFDAVVQETENEFCEEPWTEDEKALLALLDPSLADRIETWRPTFEDIERQRHFKITLRQRYKLMRLWQMSMRENSCSRHGEPGLNGGIRIPHDPVPQQYTLSKLDKSFSSQGL